MKLIVLYQNGSLYVLMHNYGDELQTINSLA